MMQKTSGLKYENMKFRLFLLVPWNRSKQDKKTAQMKTSDFNY